MKNFAYIASILICGFSARAVAQGLEMDPSSFGIDEAPGLTGDQKTYFEMMNNLRTKQIERYRTEEKISKRKLLINA